MSARDEETRRRREVARRHHPDLGGDPDEFIRAMRAISPGIGRSGEPVATNATWTTTVVTTTGTSRARRRLVSTGRRLAHHVRTRIPRSFPGSRRYGRL